MHLRVLVSRVTDVQPHPNSDKLDIITITGKTNVANRAAVDTPRYQVDDFAVVLTENLILPEWLLRHLDLWDATKQKGLLAGSRGNRTKARKIAGVLSEVALCRVEWSSEDEPVTNYPNYIVQHLKVWIDQSDGQIMQRELSRYGNAETPPFTPEGINFGELLGIEHFTNNRG
jgi:hypothetical protein